MKLKNLKRYMPEEFPMGDNVQYFKDETGKDWYEHVSKFTKKYTVGIEESSQVVCAVSTIPSKIHPENLSIVEVDTLPEGFDENESTKWMFDGKNIVKRVYSSEELQSKASATRTKLLSYANNEIALWQTELLLGTISDEDKAKLITWISYIKELKNLDLTLAPDINWPVSPEA